MVFVQTLQPRRHQFFLLLSYSLSYFTIFYINPFMSLNIALGSHQFALILAALIYIAPLAAQMSTYHLFRRIVERTMNIKLLVTIGYCSAATQMLVLYFMVGNHASDTATALVVLGFNLLNVAYVPSIKSYLATVSGLEKGKMLGRFSLFGTLSFGFGILLGGISYTFLSIHIMLLIALFVAILSIILISLIPIPSGNQLKQLILEQDTSAENAESSSKIPQKIHETRFSLRFGLIYQFVLSLISSTFFSMLAPYLNQIGYPSYVYGIANFLAMILGVIILSQAGKMLDRYGPEFMYHYGWISYGLVYALLLTTTNIIVIILIWAWPAYVFILGTEYLAATKSKKGEILKSMTWSDVSRAGGVVCGNITGGIIATFFGFQGVLMFSAIGCVGCGLFLIIYSKMLKKSK